jgi:TolA-binding protein
MFQRFSLLIVLAALAAPAAPAAANNDIKELQRDLAVLQDQVRQLQQAQDKKFADLLVVVQQAAESAARANEAVAGIQSTLQQNLRTQEEKVVAPVVGLSTRMDNLTTELRTTEQNLTDLSSQLTKILAMLDDMNKAIKVIQAPPAPPPAPDAGAAPQPGAEGAAPVPGGQAQPAAVTTPPPLSSVDMYQNALHDFQSGNYDMALVDFADYLKYFDKTPYAPNAQYYIGMIYWARAEKSHSPQDYEMAYKNLDMVLERYPVTAVKNPDAQYYKGMSLLRLGKKTEASSEFRDLILHHPRDPLAVKACQELQSLGMHCPTAAAPPATKKNAKKL